MSLSANSTNSKNTKVILAEDCPDTQMMIAYMLEKEGYDVTLADNGQECFDKICEAEGKGDKFDLVILDIQMPVMDGYQTAKMLRGTGFKQPIVALTARCGLRDAEKSLASGCNDHISKLVGKQNILSALERNLQHNITESKELDQRAEETMLVLPIESQVLKKDLTFAPLVASFLKRMPIIIKELEDCVNQEEYPKAIDKLAFFSNAELFGYPLISKLSKDLKLALENEDLDLVTRIMKEVIGVSNKMTLCLSEVEQLASRVKGDAL
jgi:CheY-like chemotaxis protein